MNLQAEVLELLSWERALGEHLDGRPVDLQRTVIREALDQRAARTALVVEKVAHVEDIDVPVVGATVRVRLYTPSGEAPHPAFLHFHGGGFIHGSIDWVYNDAKCAHICLATGCVVATVDYRLAPEFPFPTAPEDCYAALRWLVDHADEAGVDPKRVAVGGESAGGNLAAVVALMARDRGGPPLSLQLLEVPVTDMSERSDEHASIGLFGDGYGLDRAGIDAFTAAYFSHPGDRDAPYASPLRADDLTGLAPAHILTAEFDPLRDSGEAYAARLRDAGISTTLHRFGGHTHGASNLWQTWPPARAWMDEVVAAIRTATHDSVGAAP